MYDEQITKLATAKITEHISTETNNAHWAKIQSFVIEKDNLKAEMDKIMEKYNGLNSEYNKAAKASDKITKLEEMLNLMKFIQSKIQNCMNNLKQFQSEAK